MKDKKIKKNLFIASYLLLSGITLVILAKFIFPFFLSYLGLGVTLFFLGYVLGKKLGFVKGIKWGTKHLSKGLLIFPERWKEIRKEIERRESEEYDDWFYGIMVVVLYLLIPLILAMIILAVTKGTTIIWQILTNVWQRIF